MCKSSPKKKCHPPSSPASSPELCVSFNRPWRSSALPCSLCIMTALWIHLIPLLSQLCTSIKASGLILAELKGSTLQENTSPTDGSYSQDLLHSPSSKQHSLKGNVLQKNKNKKFWIHSKVSQRSQRKGFWLSCLFLIDGRKQHCPECWWNHIVPHFCSARLPCSRLRGELDTTPAP